ncbi:MAG: hypothetical protein WBG54_12555 [Acidobacteriaceae bacterium]
MSRFPLRLAWVLAAAALAMAGCATGNRELESLSITPATANSSSVQFTATGHWSQSPTTVTPEPATWGACTTGGVPTTDVTVSSTGLAACASGAKGTYNVFAWDPQYGATGAMCDWVTACGPGCGRVSATVQLTCP